MNVPAMKDVIQEVKGELKIPEIRVWCHPHEGGDDYYETFNSFKEALDFIKEHPDAERHPLIAFRGYELNMFDMKKEEDKPSELEDILSKMEAGKGRYE